MPNLGRDVVETAVSGFYSGWKMIQTLNVTPASSGRARRIWIYTPANVPTTNRCKLMVYAGLNTDSALLASGELINAVGGQWNSVAIDIPVTAGVPLYPCVVSDGTHNVQYGLGGNNSWAEVQPAQSQVYANEPLNPLTNTVSIGGVILSLYLEYDITTESSSPSSSPSNSPSSSVSNSPSTSQSNSLSHSPSTSASSSPSAGNSPSSSPSSSLSHSPSNSPSTSMSSSPSAGSVYGKIMCLGDSITYGYGVTNHASYRGKLQDYLTIGLYNFVGGPYSSEMPAPYDNNHSGISGDYIVWALERLTNTIGTYMADAGTHSAILILIGTNNVNNDSNYSNYPGYITLVSNMIDVINNFNPAIKIIFSTLPPINTANDANATYYNGLLRTMITTRKQTLSQLRLIDINAAFKANVNWSTELMVDELHPNLAGGEVMAFEWYKALMDIDFTRDQISNDLRDSIIATVRSELNAGSANSDVLMRLLDVNGTILTNHSCTLFGAPVNGVIESDPSTDNSPVNSGVPHSFQLFNRDRVLKHTGLTLGKVGTTGNVVQGVPYSITGSLFLSIPQAE